MHAAAGRGRPGWILRDTDVLRRRHLVDPPAWRHGGEPLRIATVRDGSDVRGYALLRRTEKWEDGRPRAAVHLREVVAVDAPAAHRLWTFLLDLDLTATVESPMLAVDDPLLQLLVDPREAVARLRDNLWVRLLDLPSRSPARRYAAPLDVVLGVTDARLPANAGSWRLRTVPDDDAPAQHVATVEAHRPTPPTSRSTSASSAPPTSAAARSGRSGPPAWSPSTARRARGDVDRLRLAGRAGVQLGVVTGGSSPGSAQRAVS